MGLLKLSFLVFCTFCIGLFGIDFWCFVFVGFVSFVDFGIWVVWVDCCLCRVLVIISCGLFRVRNLVFWFGFDYLCLFVLFCLDLFCLLW